MSFTLKLLLVATAIMLGWSRSCSAQRNCNGALSGIINNNVRCNGDCTLDGATVNGNVECFTGTLLVNGSSVITGGILLQGSVSSAELEAATVLGAVEVKQAASLTQLVIAATATLDSVKVENTAGDVIVAGSFKDLELIDSGNFFANSITNNLASVSVNGGTGIISVRDSILSGLSVDVRAGNVELDNVTTATSISVKGANGIVKLCDSSLGGLSVEEREGDIEVNANAENCGPTTLDGGLSAVKGSGAVTVIGASLPSGDFIVAEYTGDVILSEASIVSDAKLDKNTGSLTISNVVTDSDTTITGQVGNVVLREVNVTGDLSILEVQGDVTVEESRFALEDVSILLVSGAVIVENNTDLSLSVQEVGGMVQIIGNVVTNGNVNKNTGGVEFLDNVFQFLSCTDNVPVPSGSGNTVTFPDGQCASGFP